MKRKQVLMYVPVVHAGYLSFLERHADAEEVLLLGGGFTDQFPAMAKEIRALPPTLAADAISALVAGLVVRVVEPADLNEAIDCKTLVLPDEEIMHDLSDRYGLDTRLMVVWDRTFLRWDRPWSRPQRVDGLDPAIHLSAEDQRYMARARALADRSSDWWRQVGAVLVLADGSVMEAHNSHLPTEYAPYLDGDPRNEFHRGERMDLSTALHAEASLVAQAARTGSSVMDSKLYVTTFPCPSCARMIAEAGVSCCYFEAPYAVLEGDRVLRTAGVGLHWVPRSEGGHP